MTEHTNRKRNRGHRLDVARIIELRTAKTWSPSKLAKESKLDPSTVLAVERGDRVDLKSIGLLATALSVSPSDLFAPSSPLPEPAPAPHASAKIAPSRILRHSPARLFGREKELDDLDKAWSNAKIHIYSVVSWGGVGKTSLVAHWVIDRLAANGWPMDVGYFDWSFYSQGTSESRKPSSDLFIRKALTFFGDKNPKKGSPWERGERLAGLIRSHRTLLVLDGLEPLQYPVSDPQAGQLKDQALEALLLGLAVDNPGLCIVTTREHLRCIEGHARTEERKLDQLDKKSAVALLRHLQVAGSDEELEAACKDAGGHALTLQLLGRFLVDAHNGDIRRYKEVHFEEADLERQGRSAFRVMFAYERWLQSAGPERQRELSVLRLTGLFDRPISPDCLEALRAKPPIPGLTDALVDLKETRWKLALNRLREVELLTISSESKSIDAHPLVREYFAKRIRETHPKAFEDAHSRLFDHLSSTNKGPARSAEQLTPLYSALFHGCKARRYVEAWDEVYIRRILHGLPVCYPTRKLGLFGMDLAALVEFFEHPWDKPVCGPFESRQADLFALAGSRLRALGRLEEAVATTERSLDMYEQQEAFDRAAHEARHLAELHLARGDLIHAEKAARVGVDLADQSRVAYERYAERAILGSILHHMDKLPEEMFVEAERILLEDARYPELDYLYSLWGFRYCDFLIDEGRDKEASERGRRMREMYENGHTLQDPEGGLGLISVGLEWLILGRAGLNQLKSGLTVVSASVQGNLDRAVDELRAAGRADFIPLGYISRAAYRRLNGDARGARADLCSALAVIDRSGMKTHKVDYFLELARLELKFESPTEVEYALRMAQELIDETHYARRKQDLSILNDEFRIKFC